MSTITFPEVTDLTTLGISPHVAGLIRDWADNDEADIMVGVDEQASALSANGTIPSGYLNGGQKDALSQVMAYKAARLFREGTYWAIRQDRPEGANLEAGQRVRVSDEGYRNSAGQSTFIGVKAVNEDGDFINESEWRVHASSLRNVVIDAEPVEDKPTYEELEAKVASLTSDVEALSRRSESANTRANNLYRALETVNQGLNDEGEKRNWCSELEDFYMQVNAEITGYEFEGREHEFEVSIRVPVTVWAELSTTVTAHRGTEHSDLEEMALESVSSNYSNSDLLDQADSYSADADWDNAEAEVQ